MVQKDDSQEYKFYSVAKFLTFPICFHVIDTIIDSFLSLLLYFSPFPSNEIFVDEKKFIPWEQSLIERTEWINV